MINYVQKIAFLVFFPILDWKHSYKKKYFISDKSLSERRSASSYNITGVLHRDFHHWEKPYLDEWKISKIFSRVCSRQSATATSLALLSAMFGNVY